MKILVVDSLKGFPAIIRFILEPAHEVLEASGNLDAMEVIGAVNIDLVITDHDPPVDGVRLAEWVKEHWPDLPVVIMSRGSRPANSAADYFLQKPFDQESLQLIIRALEE